MKRGKRGEVWEGEGCERVGERESVEEKEIKGRESKVRRGRV